ncbi:DUF1877 family protein [Streptomyces venezuelae]|nr:DUF1877 family protein [Streptomyces venezuelae]
MMRMPEEALREGFDAVVRRFEEAESASADGTGGVPAGTFCDLGEEAWSLRAALTPATGAETAENVTDGGRFLGDDELGTACAYLTSGEVAGAAGALAAIDVRSVLAASDPSVFGIRGSLPPGYLDSVREQAEELVEFFTAAAKAGECVVKRIEE